MRLRSHLPAALLRWGFPLTQLLTLASCLLIVSSEPTPVSGGTIVFVAFDGHGVRVASLRITVVDVHGAWQAAGHTGRDGSFRCAVPSTVRSVRATAAPPPGYALTGPESWPRELDVPAGGSLDVEVVLTGSPD